MSAEREPTDRPRTIADLTRRPDRPWIIAHRGLSSWAPENTLPAFLRAVEIGADLIELDVTWTSDRELVVLHDDTLDRTTNGSGPVLDRAWTDVAKLDAGAWFDERFAGTRVPTLAAVFALVRDAMPINVEVKAEAVTDDARGGIVDAVLACVKAAGGSDRVYVSSFDPRALVHARSLAPDIARGVLWDRKAYAGRSPGDVVREHDAIVFSASRREIDAKMVASAHDAGAIVAVYTVNDVADMRRLRALGVDAFFSDRADALLDAVRPADGATE